MWQDTVFTLGAFLLSAMLIPTLIDSKTVILRKTSVPTVGVILSFVFAFYTLGLYYSAIANALNAVLWVLIAIYRGPKQRDTLYSAD